MGFFLKEYYHVSARVKIEALDESNILSVAFGSLVCSPFVLSVRSLDVKYSMIHLKHVSILDNPFVS